MPTVSHIMRGDCQPPLYLTLYTGGNFLLVPPITKLMPHAIKFHLSLPLTFNGGLGMGEVRLYLDLQHTCVFSLS